MKKLIFAIFIFTFFTIAFAIDATVISVKGRVEMQIDKNWIPVKINDTIEQGTVISTGYNSEVVLKFKDTNFKLGALTRATIEELIEENDRDAVNLFIDTGKISASVNKSEGKRVGFKVRSPIATASVRGTELSITATGELFVERGEVSFMPADYEGEKILISADQSSNVDESTNQVINPANKKTLASVGGSSSTLTLSEKEAVATVTTSGTSNDSTSGIFTVSYSKTKTDVNITIEFPATSN